MKRIDDVSTASLTFLRRIAFLGGSALFLVAGAPSVSAQEPGPGEVECRCVDDRGREIEDCACLRPPSFEGFMPPALMRDSRPRLGITVTSRQGGGDVRGGVEIADVLEGGPADRAGLQSGDVITHVNGHALSATLDAEDEEDFDVDASMPVQRLVRILSRVEPGSSVDITYVRDGRQSRVQVDAEDLSDWGPMAYRPFDHERLREEIRSMADRARAWGLRMVPGEVELGHWRDEDRPRARLRMPGLDLLADARRPAGVEVVEVNPELGAYFDADTGVLVVEVDESDDALGLEPGDVVTAVDGRPVDSPRRFWTILESYRPGEEISFEVLRRGEEHRVEGTLPS